MDENRENSLKGGNTLELASLVNNVSVGCSYYLYYKEKVGKDELTNIVRRYFSGAENLTSELESVQLRMSKGLVLGSGNVIELVGGKIEQLKKYEETFTNKIPHGEAKTEEVEEVKKIIDSIAAFFLLKSHAEWLEELEKYGVRT